MKDARPEQGGRPAAPESLDEFNFHARLAETRGTAVVLFGAPGCGACRSARERLPALLRGRGVRLFDVDVEASLALAREYEVFHLPALFVFRDGRYHAPLTAPLTAALAGELERVLACPAEEEP